MPDYELKSIHIDLNQDIFEINGKSIKGLPITELNLKFNGSWELDYKIEYFASTEKELDTEVPSIEIEPIINRIDSDLKEAIDEKKYLNSASIS